MKKILLAALMFPALLAAQQDSFATQPDPPFISVPAAPDCQYPAFPAHDNIITADADSSEEKHKKFVRFISISSYGGGEIYREGFQDRTAFQQATPNSTLAFADISGHGNNNFGYGMMLNSSASSGINVNVRLRCQQKFGELRFGISHSVVSFASQYYFMETVTPLDTTLLPGGEALHSDSVAYSTFSYEWYSDIIQLHLGWIVRTDPKRLVNLYTGVGFYGGIGFNGVLEYNHRHSSLHQHYLASGAGMNYTTNYEVISDVNEQYRAPMFKSFGVYVPIGFNIRLSRRNNFLRHLTLYGEYNGAIQFLVPKDVDAKVRTVSGMYGGMRWYIHAPKGNKGSGHHRGKHHRYHHDQQQNQNENHQHNPAD